ncbi:MAG: PilZ domain-containing protein [Candidatus Eisenbacteria bacterium]|uniref:PilZ domain-containing protein n=1 Tax=Eiseniibacteriota bacterium TaxID=2212470 RepID=A0A7Y2EAV5_UNCEI|nr:PilZ domain-containing protein [Candidatus Eisenbacteria bacterium]
MTNEVKDRRKAPRIGTRLALQVERTARTATERPLTTESTNLSSGGISASVRNPLEPLTKVGLTLLLPSFGRKGKKTQVITCGGVVVRCEPVTGDEDFELACAFTDVKKEDKLLIEEYIGWRLIQDSVDDRLSQP